MDGSKVIVIDVPFEAEGREEKEAAARKDAAGAYGDEQKICWHTNGTGEVCGRPVVERSDECLEHTLWDTVVPDGRVLPYPEDATSIHRILAYLLGRAIIGEFEPKRLFWVVTLCREIRLNLRQVRAEKRRLQIEDCRLKM